MRFCNQCGEKLVLGLNWTEARKNQYTYTCNSCLNTRSLEWRLENPERVRITHQRMGLKKYGLSLEEYDNLCQKSGNTCYICGRHRSLQKKNLHVDHNHATGEVRGLLCSNCNTALGKFQENIFILKKAIDYLGGVDEN